MRKIKPKILKRPDAICTADIHLRDTQPECRTDDFLEAQMAKMVWLKQLQERYECPILCAGDVFQIWRSSPYLIGVALRYLPEMVSIPGQHDLPGHNITRIAESAYWTLVSGGILTDLSDGEIGELDGYDVYGYPFGAAFRQVADSATPKVALIHHHVYKGRKPFPGATGGVEAVMRKLPGYRMIVSGDNHIPFTHKNAAGQLLINCGSLTRQTASQVDFRPRVYLWYRDTNTAEPAYLPIVQRVITRAHIDDTKEREHRLDSFVERLKTNTLSTDGMFEENLRKYQDQNKITKRVRRKISEAM
jgi:hypothetical protein